MATHDNIVARLARQLHDPGSWSDEQFDAAALELYAHQRASVPTYDAWCSHELGQRPADMRRVRSWRDVPALPIEAFRTLDVFDTTQPVAARFESSATTSHARGVHRLGSLEHYEASIDAGVEAALVPDVVAGESPALACVQLHPSSDTVGSSSLSYMYDRIRTGPWCVDAGAYVDASWRVDARVAWSRLEELAGSERPVLVLATSFALAMLLERAQDLSWEPLHLPVGSRVVDTGGYKGRTRELTRAQLLDRVERQLGVPASWCENEYGMSELSSQAWLGTVAEAAGHPVSRPAPAARFTPPWLRVRVVDPSTLTEVADGEQGLLVFHDLANVWSCAAVRSEDIGVRCGAGFELVGRAPGAVSKGCSLQLADLVG